MLSAHSLATLDRVSNSPNPRRPQWAAECVCGHVAIGLPLEGNALAAFAQHLANPERAPGAGAGFGFGPFGLTPFGV